jgi:hypothetical protein
MKFDIKNLTNGVDTALSKTTNRLHRAILLNYRRHQMLEVSGRYQEIFVPEMTVEEPEYFIYGGFHASGVVHLKGETAVKSHYKSMVDRKVTVIMLEQEKVAVADWGFASEAMFHTFKPGRECVNSFGAEIDDPEAVFLESRSVCMAWRYDERGRMIGESVYSAPKATLRKVQPAELLTVEQVRETLAPLINEVEPLEFA